MKRALLALPLLLLSCSSGATAKEQPIVFAAASLTSVFRVLDPNATYEFAGSSALARQIREGAKADVFASASEKYPAELFAQQLVDEPRTFATNTLALIVPVGASNVRDVRDLNRRGVRVAIGAQGVPVGDYARMVLARLDETGVADRASQEDDVKGVVTKVALGEVDAGFAYVTDIRAVASKVRVIEIPAFAQPSVRYSIAVVRNPSHASAAMRFVETVLGAQGRTALRAAGFGLP